MPDAALTVPAVAGRGALLTHPRLEVRRLLGSGGMGVVYAAYDPVLDREVAVKAIRVGGPRSAARLLREARAIARVSHPSVLHVYGADPIGDQVVVVMELVAGQTLAAWLDTPRPWQAIVATFAEAGRGLAAAHAAGLVHRDFKPHNAMVRDDGRVCVLDFGLARGLDLGTDDSSDAPPSSAPLAGETTHASSDDTLDGAPFDGSLPSRLTQTGAVVGTPQYMAPEQHVGGAVDARADQFAFCVALYRALFGIFPFAGDTSAELMRSMLGDELRRPARTRVPHRIGAVLARGLSRRPDDRFPSMDALLAALARASRRRRWPMAVLAAGAVVLAAAVALWPGRPAMAQVRLQQLTFDGDVWTPEVSPDGRWLAYLRGTSIYVRRLDRPGGEDRLIASDGAPGSAPQWSWQSDALLAWSSSHEAIILYDVTGTAPPRTIAEYGVATFASPHELLLYVYNRPEVEVRNTRTGATRTCIIPGAFDWTLHAQVSPRTGHMLVMTSTDATDEHRLLVLDTDCRGAREILAFSGGHSDALDRVSITPRWDPTGTRVIAAVTSASGNQDLVAIDADAPHATRTLAEGVDVDWFSVAPDGSIHFSRQTTARQYWIAGPGSRTRRLTSDARPRWLTSVTPAGEALYVERDGGAVALVRQNVYTLRRTTLLRRSPGQPRLLDATWSPDGTRIALRESHDGIARVAFIDADGGGYRLEDAPETRGAREIGWIGDALLLRQPGNRNFRIWTPSSSRLLRPEGAKGWAFAPVPSPDRSEIAVSGNIANVRGLWLIDVADGSQHLVARDMYPIAWAPDGESLYAAPVAGKDRSVVQIARGGNDPPQPHFDLSDVADALPVAMTSRDEVVLLIEQTPSDLFVLRAAL